jgi:hypothetical protein
MSFRNDDLGLGAACRCLPRRESKGHEPPLPLAADPPQDARERSAERMKSRALHCHPDA